MFSQSISWKIFRLNFDRNRSESDKVIRIDSGVCLWTFSWWEIEIFRMDPKIEGSDRCWKNFPTEFWLISVEVGRRRRNLVFTPNHEKLYVCMSSSPFVSLNDGLMLPMQYHCLLALPTQYALNKLTQYLPLHIKVHSAAAFIALIEVFWYWINNNSNKQL